MKEMKNFVIGCCGVPVFRRHSDRIPERGELSAR